MLVVKICMLQVQRIDYLIRQDSFYFLSFFLKGQHTNLGVKFTVLDRFYLLKKVHERIIRSIHRRCSVRKGVLSLQLYLKRDSATGVFL